MPRERCRDGRRDGRGRARRRGRHHRTGTRRRWRRAAGRGWSGPPTRPVPGDPAGPARRGRPTTRVVASEQPGPDRVMGTRLDGTADAALTPADLCFVSADRGGARPGRAPPRRRADAVPAGKTTELLVRLALDAGVPVRPTVSSTSCGRRGHRLARNTLQSKVVQAAAGARRRAPRQRRRHRLHPAHRPRRVDALDVLRVAARDSAAAGRDRHGMPPAPALAAVPRRAAARGDWAAPYRARLDEARAAADRGPLRRPGCTLGADGELVGELEALVAADRCARTLWELLITALYRAGRQADALAAYRRVRRPAGRRARPRPGPELRELETRILQQDRRPARRPARPPATCPAPVRARSSAATTTSPP